MADIAPFRGLLFDPDAVGDLGHVVAPPYDVISDAARDALEAASPYNVVRLILGKDEPGDDAASNKYMRARALLETWCAAGVLRRDQRPALYVYEEEQTIAGVTMRQRGLLTAVKLEADANGVLPHERTYDDIVDDRLALMRATAANLDPVFGVYAGRDSTVTDVIEDAARRAPLLSCSSADGARHALWRIDDSPAIEQVVGALEKETVIIADGHHRWRTAGRYRDERLAAEGDGPWTRALMFLVDATRHGPGLLPIHRVLKGPNAREVAERARASFDAEPVAVDAPALARLLVERRASARCFGVLDAADAFVLTARDEAAIASSMPHDRSTAWRNLDVAVVQVLMFDRLLGGVQPTFVHSPEEAFEQVRAGTATAAILLAPMPFDAVQAVAEAGEAMPPKSTYFVPKPATGLVMRLLDQVDGAG